IANRLAGLFIERTSSIRGERVQQEDKFLDAEVERLRRELSAQEEGVKTYKQNGAQELPERLANNLRLIEDLRQQIQSKTDQISEGQARRSAVMEEMQALERQGALEAEPAEKTATDTAIEELRLKLTQLKARYT